MFNDSSLEHGVAYKFDIVCRCSSKANKDNTLQYLNNWSMIFN